jgi:L-alanine-DL-glutamate epimerase-like enolase superfamily enzyme
VRRTPTKQDFHAVRVTAVECHILLDPDYQVGATSSAQDDLVVEVHTDDGLVGIGEADVNPWVGWACIMAPGTHTMDRGLGHALLGLDPSDPEAVWEELYRATAMTGRRGALIHAMGAIDMALWDLRGKAAGVPTWKLLGTKCREWLTPYASLQPEVGDFDGYVTALVDWASRSKALGYPAVKLSLTFGGPYAHMGVRVPDERMAAAIVAVREAVGPEIAIMVDVQYAFQSVEQAATAINQWKDLDVYFVETPLWPDDLGGYAELAHRVDTPIASGEWLSTRFEFEDLLDRGQVAIAQPDIGRVGGLTEARRVCQLTASRGRRVVPHGWKTGISVAAAAHLATVTENMPFFEYLPPSLSESPLRQTLVHDEHVIRDGRLPIPAKPGLGFELDRSALERFEEAARAVAGPLPWSGRLLAG